jgi:hypothetical protein
MFLMSLGSASITGRRLPVNHIRQQGTFPFCQYSIDTQDPSSYILAVKKEVLINHAANFCYEGSVNDFMTEQGSISGTACSALVKTAAMGVS